MRSWIAILAAAAVLSAFAEDPPDPKAEWDEMWPALAKSAARAHVSVGMWAGSKKLYSEASYEFQRAVELDPENSDAQKGLGRKLIGGAWVPNSKTPPKKGSEAPAADVPKLLADLEAKRKDCAGRLARQFTALAEWAEKKGLKEEASALWQQVVDFYDPTSDKAHAGIGHVKDDSMWVPPGDAEKRKDGAKRIADAPKGEAVNEKSEVERALGVSHSKRRSKHFFVEGPYTDAQIAELIQIAEAARGLFLELVEADQDACEISIHIMAYKEQDVYSRYVKADPRVPENQKKAYATKDGYPAANPWAFCTWQGDRSWDYVRDWAAHMTVHVLLYEYHNVYHFPIWLIEGISYWATDRLLHTAKFYCSPFTTTKEGGRDFEDMREWKPEVKRLERMGLDPALSDLFQMDELTMRGAMKVWSIVEWLVSERRKDFLKFVLALRNGSKPEEAVAAALGVKTLEKLDLMWKAYVRMSY